MLPSEESHHKYEEGKNRTVKVPRPNLALLPVEQGSFGCVRFNLNPEKPTGEVRRCLLESVGIDTDSTLKKGDVSQSILAA